MATIVLLVGESVSMGILQLVLEQKFASDDSLDEDKISQEVSPSQAMRLTIIWTTLVCEIVASL